MRIGVRQLVATSVLAALAVAVQVLGLPQPVTGPAVNAVLYVASLYVGPLSGIFVGLITPWAALLAGIMKFAPAVPVIMAGNASLALTAGLVGKRSPYVGMALAALVKYGVMTAGIRYLVSNGTAIPALVHASLTTTQLVTALAGAVVAALVLQGLKKRGRDDVGP